MFSAVTMNGQNCSDLLSKAEQYYQAGQLMNIRDSINADMCKCLGIYRVGKKDKILPAGYRFMITEMQKADTAYTQQIGIFKGLYKDFIMSDGEYKNRKDKFFSTEEKKRFFILMGNLYAQLGVISLAEYFAQRAIIIERDDKFENDSTGFNRAYQKALTQVRGFTIGPSVGWVYNIVTDKKINLPGTASFKYQTNANIMFGAELNFYLKDNLIVNVNALINSIRVVYTQQRNPSLHKYDLYFSEKQNWIRLPLMIRWSSRDHLNLFRRNGRPVVKLFFATGISFDYLESAKVTLADIDLGRLWNDLSLTGNRNRFNYEYLLHTYARFKIGNDYLNFGFMGSRLLKDVSNQQKIAGSMLSTDYGIKENNYKLLMGTWLVSYEFRIDWLKKGGRLIRGSR